MPAQKPVGDLSRGVGLVFLPTTMAEMTASQVDEYAQLIAPFVSEQRESLGAADVTKAFERARGDPGFRDCIRQGAVEAVHFLVPEAMPELDYCKWNGDGHYNMSKFPGLQPPTLGQVVCFLRLLDVIVAKGAAATIVVCSPERQATVAVLAGAALILQQELDAESAWEELQRCAPAISPSVDKAWDRFPGPFSRSGIKTKTSLRVCDCLAGLVAAKELGWLENYTTFDVASWTLLRRKFDASWLIPGEMLALANPWGTSLNPAFPGLLTPEVTMGPTGSGPGEYLAPRLSETRPLPDIPKRSMGGGLTKAVSLNNFFGIGSLLSRGDAPASESTEGSPVRRSTSETFVGRSCSLETGPPCRKVGSDSAPQPLGTNSDVLLEEGDLEHSPDITTIVSPKSITSVEDWEGAWSSEDVERGVTAAKEARLYPRTGGATSEALSGPMQHYRSSKRCAPPMRPSGDVEAADPEGMATPRRSSMANPRGDCASEEASRVAEENFVTYFCRKGIKSVARLNENFECPEQERYADVFSACGIDIKAAPFPDGDIPPKAVVRTFISHVRNFQQLNPDKCVAVHCMGGLGRTGALIGAYAVSKYDMDGKAFHGWTRMCRPGTVQTEKQEAFLRSLRRKTPILKTATLGISKMMSRMSIGMSAMTRSYDTEDSGERTTSPCRKGEEQLVLQVYMAEGGIAEL